MMYVPDTNVLSELRKVQSGKADASVAAWAESVDVAGLFVSAITLPLDTAVALRRAKLHAPDRRGERDALIAATALVHGMAVVTCNVADFKPTGVALIDPWRALL